jgi:hypothetical protein
MQKYRIIYFILWLLTVIAYSMPWARVDSELYIGWSFTLPFSITYVIGIVTIIAGILMLLGVASASVLYIEGVGPFFFGRIFRAEAGTWFAFLMSIIFTVAGAYVGKKHDSRIETVDKGDRLLLKNPMMLNSFVNLSRFHRYSIQHR